MPPAAPRLHVSPRPASERNGVNIVGSNRRAGPGLATTRVERNISHEYFRAFPSTCIMARFRRFPAAAAPPSRPSCSSVQSGSFRRGATRAGTRCGAVCARRPVSVASRADDWFTIALRPHVTGKLRRPVASMPWASSRSLTKMRSCVNTTICRVLASSMRRFATLARQR